MAAIDDVFDNQHVASLNRLIEVFENTHDTTALGICAVAAGRHKVDLMRDMDGTDEVGHKDDAAFEHRNEQQVLAAIGMRNFCPHFADACLDRSRVEQY